MTERHDVWAVGDQYERYVGRWSRLVAMEFVDWLHVGRAKDWLDVGCGTGALTEVILDSAEPRSVKGIDPSSGFIEHAKTRVRGDVASFEVGDARSLPAGTNGFDVAVAGLSLNFVPQPARAVSEMARAVRPGGTVAAYVWDYAGRMELMRYFWDAAIALDPAASDLDEGPRFPVCRPDPLAELFAAADLHAVDVKAIDVATHFADLDDYWSPFLGGQGPAPAYAMSLSDQRRRALRERLHVTLPIAQDGSIDLIARAWAVRGEVPA